MEVESTILIDQKCVMIWSATRQKGESQDEVSKKTKHAQACNFIEKETPTKVLRVRIRG